MQEQCRCCGQATRLHWKRPGLVVHALRDLLRLTPDCRLLRQLRQSLPVEADAVAGPYRRQCHALLEDERMLDIPIEPETGSFGRLLGGHLPKISTGSGANCVVLAVLAPLLLRADAVDVLRYTRDAILLKTPAGERAVKLYYEHGREIISLLATRPILACKAAAIASELVDNLRVGGRVSANTRNDAVAFVHALLPLTSPQLHRDIEETFRGDPWALLQPV